MSIRIWHQSITDLTALPGYQAALCGHVSAVCDPSVSVTVHGVRPGSYPQGIAPIEASRYPWMHALMSAQIVQNAILAEQEGYDAVAISCFLDPGLREARASVGVPVVSMLESSLLLSAAVSDRVGLIGLGGDMAAQLRGLAGGYGAGSRIAAVTAITPDITEPELEDRAAAPAVLDRVRRAAAAAVAAGADLIVPAEGVLNTLLVRLGVRELGGVPVLDSYGLLLNHAVMLVQLWRRTGLCTSRAGRYARPPEPMREHITAVAAAALRAADRDARGAQAGTTA